MINSTESSSLSKNLNIIYASTVFLLTEEPTAEVVSRYSDKRLRVAIYNQQIGNQLYTYFIADKKNNSNVLYNTRFFVLRGNHDLSYASNYDSKTKLPFRTVQAIPTTKKRIPLEYSTRVEKEDTVLRFYYNQDTLEKQWMIRTASPEMAETISALLNSRIQSRVMFVKAQRARMEESKGVKPPPSCLTPSKRTNLMGMSTLGKEGSSKFGIVQKQIDFQSKDNNEG